MLEKDNTITPCKKTSKNAAGTVYSIFLVEIEKVTRGANDGVEE